VEQKVNLDLLLHLWTTSMHALHKRLDCAAILVKVIPPHRVTIAELEDLGRKLKSTLTL